MAFQVDYADQRCCVGSSGPLVITSVRRAIDHASARGITGVLSRVAAAYDARLAYLHLTVLDGSSSIADAAVVREAYGEVLRKLSHIGGVLAFVSENEGIAGAIIRSTFTGLMAFVPKIRSKAFAEPALAADWLAVRAASEGIVTLPARGIVAAVELLRSQG